MPEIVLATPLSAAPSACFALSLSVDAHTVSMGRSGERAVAGVTSGELFLGNSVTWQARHFGLPFRMTVKITAHDPPHSFVDEQTRGPFASWWHQHRFEPHAGGTLMTDTVRFRSPLGPLGSAVDALVLHRYLQRLIRTRNTWLATHLD